MQGVRRMGIGRHQSTDLPLFLPQASHSEALGKCGRVVAKVVHGAADELKWRPIPVELRPVDDE